jgi:hypothetical protein
MRQKGIMASLFAMLCLAGIFYRVFSKDGREVARQRPYSEKKTRLYIAGAGMSAWTLFVAYNILQCHLHQVPVLNVFWVALVVGIAGALWAGRGIILLTHSSDNGMA